MLVVKMAEYPLADWSINKALAAGGLTKRARHLFLWWGSLSWHIRRRAMIVLGQMRILFFLQCISACHHARALTPWSDPAARCHGCPQTYTAAETAHRFTPPRQPPIWRDQQFDHFEKFDHYKKCSRTWDQATLGASKSFTLTAWGLGARVRSRPMAKDDTACPSVWAPSARACAGSACTTAGTTVPGQPRARGQNRFDDSS